MNGGPDHQVRVAAAEDRAEFGHRPEGRHIDNFGTERWFAGGVRHRDNAPAVTWRNGSMFWFTHGILQRAVYSRTRTAQ